MKIKNAKRLLLQSCICLDGSLILCLVFCRLYSFSSRKLNRSGTDLTTFPWTLAFMQTPLDALRPCSRRQERMSGGGQHEAENDSESCWMRVWELWVFVGKLWLKICLNCLSVIWKYMWIISICLSLLLNCFSLVSNCFSVI